jgi:hypothetical protein
VPHGFSQQVWDAAKTEIKEVLVARAKVRGAIPYSEEQVRAALTYARQIRIDRRVAEDEVVRVALHGQGGAVLSKGEAR